MKKIFNKEAIIGFVVGVILTSGVAVYATMNAKDITYKDGQNVEKALDDLYGKTKYLNETDATETDIISGKKAYTKEGLITGTLNNSLPSNKISFSLFNQNETAQIALTESLVNTYTKIKVISKTIYTGNTCEYGICTNDGSTEMAFTLNQEYNIQSLYNSGYTKIYIRSNGWAWTTYEMYN